MKFHLSSPAVVETDQGYLLVPAGLFKYKVVSTRDKKEFTFWSEFFDDPEEKTENPPKRVVVLSLSKPPFWDDGSEISREEFGDIAEVIGEGFSLKGYPAIFTTISGTNGHWSSATQIFETEGGKWLDEVSRDKNLSDSDRDRLWTEAMVSFRQANAKTFEELRVPSSDSDETK